MQIFMSYSRKDKAIAKLLAQDIQDLGHTLWRDQELSGGQTWWDEILSRIRNCEVFVFVLSEDALKSEPCKREYTYAAQLGKRILPALVADEVSVNLLPQELSKIQFLDYRLHDKAALLALNKSFQNLPPQRPLPARLPTPPSVPVAYLSGIREKLALGLPQDVNSQIALVFDLKSHLDDADEHDDALKLLEETRRSALLATVASEIDTILAGTAKFRGGSATSRRKPIDDEYTPPPAPKPVLAADKPEAAAPAKSGGIGRFFRVVGGIVTGFLAFGFIWGFFENGSVLPLALAAIFLAITVWLVRK